VKLKEKIFYEKSCIFLKQDILSYNSMTLPLNIEAFHQKDLGI